MARVAGAVGPCADHDVRLVGVFVHDDFLRAVFRDSSAPDGCVVEGGDGMSLEIQGLVSFAAFGQREGDPFQGFIYFAAHGGRRDASENEKHHVVRTVEPGGEALHVHAAEFPQPAGFAQDVASEGMAAEHQVLEIVENQFGRRVVVALYFVDDHFHFLVHFRLRIGAAQRDVHEQVCGAGEMLFQEGRVVDGFLLSGVSVQVSAHGFHAVQDVPGASAVCPLERQVLAEMRQPVFVRQFVPCARVDGDAAVGHVRGRRCADDA